MDDSFIAGPDDPILVTGAAGFIGRRLIESLSDRGFRNVRAFVRPASDETRVRAIAGRPGSPRIDVIKGNLLSREDCSAATNGATIIFHLAAGRGEKSFPDAFMNS